MTRIAIASVFACLLAGAAHAQTTPAAKPSETKPPGAAEPKMDPKMMEAMARYGTPGEEHKKLKSLTGTWDAKVTFWMDPKGPPMESTGTSEFKMILGDRFLQQEFTGEGMAPGEKFTGWGFTAYNNILKHYESVWMDSMSTGFYRGEGTHDKSGAITLKTTGTDPTTGKTMKGRDVWKIEGDKKMTFQMFGPAPKGGKEYKMMEIVYTKK